MREIVALEGELLSWLRGAALPLWWNIGADHEGGGFFEALNRAGQPVQANRRARVQARQIYVYATAGRLGWDGPWRKAMEHGLRFLLARYPREDGFFRTLVAPDGSPVDNGAWLYDQAFALFSMAQAQRAAPELGLDAKAHALRMALDAWRLPEGGYREAEAEWVRQSNPHMHLLEASLAWSEIDDDPAWLKLVDEIGTLALSNFIDRNGALHEYFVEGWQPAPGVAGRLTEPGHQLEWAWLMERWARLTSNRNAHRAARRLFEIGIQWGVRDNRGVTTQQVLDDGTIHDDVARLWPQTERIKAALIMGDEEEAVRGVLGLQKYLATPTRGAWFDKLRPDETFVDEPSPASSLYHIVCAIDELSGYLKTVSAR